MTVIFIITLHYGEITVVLFVIVFKNVFIYLLTTGAFDDPFHPALPIFIVS